MMNENCLANDIKESKELSSGIFWVLTDDINIKNYEFIFFDIPCGPDGMPNGNRELSFNSKNGLGYNHEGIWNTVIKENKSYHPYNKQEYNYYPRGRVQIANDKAIIYLNPNINREDIINKIITSFGLSSHNISNTRVINDNSRHYQCWLDNEFDELLNQSVN